MTFILAPWRRIRMRAITGQPEKDVTTSQQSEMPAKRQRNKLKVIVDPLTDDVKFRCYREAKPDSAPYFSSVKMLKSSLVVRVQSWRKNMNETQLENRCAGSNW